MKTLSFGEVKIKPFLEETLLYFKVEEELNEHSSISFRLLLSEESKDSYIKNWDKDTKISLVFNNEEGEEILFSGKIFHMEIENNGEVYELIAKAYSHSRDLDIKLERKSYQDKELTYKAILEGVEKNYENCFFEDMVSEKKKIEKLLLQYNETDWQFAKRLASHFNAPLVIAAYRDSPIIYFGLSKAGKEEEMGSISFSVTKNIEEYKVLKANNIQELREREILVYKVQNDKYFKLGQKIKFQDKITFIRKSSIELKNGLISSKYELIPEEGVKSPKLNNKLIQGMSIFGKVLEVNKDCLKVHLEIDENQDKNKASLFKYATTYTGKGQTGWYCMPEIGDYVRLYFPSPKEYEAIATDSSRLINDKNAKISNPDIAYFRTPSGKEIMFSPGGILITGKGEKVYINLSSKEGISIVSDSSINISAGQDININASKNLLINAKGKIELNCKESFVKMDGNIEMKGNNIKAN